MACEKISNMVVSKKRCVVELLCSDSAHEVSAQIKFFKNFGYYVGFMYGLDAVALVAPFKFWTAPSHRDGQTTLSGLKGHQGTFNITSTPRRSAQCR